MSSTLTLYTGVAGVKIRLWSEAFKHEDHSSDGAWDERMTDAQGNTSFMQVPAGESTAYLTKLGYKPVQVDYTMPADGARMVPMNLESLKRLHIAGRHFHDGDRPVWIFGADCYAGYQRFLEGEDLTPIFMQLQAKGFNAIRVFGTIATISEQIGKGWLAPGRYNEYYNGIRPFVSMAASYGLYVLWVTFADTGRTVPSEPARAAHFDRVVAELSQEANTIGSVGNELRQHDNFVDVGKLTRPTEVAFSAGSEGGDTPTFGPWWDFDEFHPRRDYREKAIKDCNVVDHPNYVHHGVAILIDEPNRFGDQGVNDPEYCGLQAAAAVESAAGIIIHSKRGVWAQSFDPLTEAHIDAAVSAVHPYIRGG